MEDSRAIIIFKCADSKKKKRINLRIIRDNSTTIFDDLWIRIAKWGGKSFDSINRAPLA